VTDLRRGFDVGGFLDSEVTDLRWGFDVGGFLDSEVTDLRRGFVAICSPRELQVLQTLVLC
jgi:hypothetical protein